MNVWSTNIFFLHIYIFVFTKVKKKIYDKSPKFSLEFPMFLHQIIKNIGKLKKKIFFPIVKKKNDMKEKIFFDQTFRKLFRHA